MLVQRKSNQKKRRFFLGIFSLKAKNHKEIPKFFPKLQKFLTEIPYYTGEKEEKLISNSRYVKTKKTLYLIAVLNLITKYYYIIRDKSRLSATKRKY